jgi:hypothetical protein
MMKLIGYQTQSQNYLDDDTTFIIDGMLTLVEKGLSSKRTTLYFAAELTETDVVFEDDEDFQCGDINIFAIVEAEHDETLQEAEQKARAELRTALLEEYGKSGVKQKQLF